MIGCHGVASALSDLPPAGGSAGVARPLVGVEGRRVTGAPPRGRRVCVEAPRNLAWSGPTGLFSRRWSGCCPRRAARICCAATKSSSVTRAGCAVFADSAGVETGRPEQRRRFTRRAGGPLTTTRGRWIQPDRLTSRLSAGRPCSRPGTYSDRVNLKFQFLTLGNGGESVAYRGHLRK
jgi:hypothetical protein